jgi:NO-binding membrane sensor protein with MHYT domain
MNSSDTVMVTSHNHILVALSVAVSILAAYATIAVVQRLRDAYILLSILQPPVLMVLGPPELL